MSLVMVIAVVKFGNVKENISQTGSIRKEIVIYTTFLSVIASIITIISLSQPLPFLTIDFIIKRPYEMAAAILFAVAVIFFYKRKLYAINDTFFKGLLLALIIDVFVNLIISYSSSVFDTAFNVAHILKNVSYFVFIITLSSSAIFHYTLKEKLANELKDIDTKKEEFTSMVTHELKTPLTPILGWLSVLDKGDLLGTLNDKQKTAVRKVLTNSRRLNNLISDLLDAQKLDLGKMTFDIASFDVNSMISGPEISDLDKLFEPLYSTKPRGTGLGLASCKNIIESHDGTISASNNPKKFVITLPITN
jgi:signal transduction histidine kinase